MMVTSPTLADVREKAPHFPDFSISEVAINETEGMVEWWARVDALLNEGRSIRLAVIVNEEESAV